MWHSTTKQYNTRNVAVGTVKKSTDARTSTWLLRNVLHVCDGGCFPLVIYFDTVDSATA
jgi:hypothetical protein